ncbi:MAG: hypothetical protein NUV45_05140 [Tepidanaerobacteraceae bacterium]|jgi:hypothetical protein|nr:hypothetical protein [Tepidanaerobacteraceae bacterium]
MGKIIHALAGYLKGNITMGTMAVFLVAGIYILAIDCADLKNKGLKKELAAARIIGVLYIFGSLMAFVISKYIL